MAKNLSCLLGMGVGLLLGVAQIRAEPAEQVTKDASGRVTSRRTTHPDGSSHRTSLQYRSDAAQPQLVVDEDIDARQRVTARVEQRFDDGGRLVEKTEIRIDPAGKRSGTRTRFSYDSAGRRFEQASPVE